MSQGELSSPRGQRAKQDFTHKAKRSPKAISSSGCFAAAGGVFDWRHTLDAAIGGLGIKIYTARGALATANPHTQKASGMLFERCAFIWRCGESFFPTGWCRSLPKLTYKNAYKTLII